ncbi:ABC transporter ATP-binding protein [Eubacterium oxidoreducens]|uniref:ABC-type quaternary amine transporter n=1 Tax=Eubacterium oxidoreducens TaxID=1732 RepID=A0A1G6A505_EUBOX|nr:ABC transporter ATP-binding protein [Eubacterium oxidoreducens]SDB03508.1 sulfate transport system ATP-binding protein [Eubacterium oxidoreducens]
MFVELKNINKSFGDFQASKDVSFGIEKGSLVALLGPSGSGKTTILRMLAGLEHPDSGEIYIDGKLVNNVPAAKRGIGFVFQNYALFRYMTVYENIAFGLELRKVPKKQIKERVKELLELTGLSGMEKRYPNQLSGGQRQRVAFARALAPQPDVLLLDEPFAAIDAKVRQELRSWLKDMIKKVGITSIFVTHDQEEALEVSDQIIVTNCGQVEQIGSPVEICRQPQTQFVTEFVGDTQPVEEFSMLNGFVAQGYDGAAIRPEFVEAFKKDNLQFKNVIDYAEDGTVSNVQFRGDYLEVTLDVKGMELKTHRSLERRSIAIGEAMKVIIYKIYAYQNGQVVLLENENLIGEHVVNF